MNQNNTDIDKIVLDYLINTNAIEIRNQFNN